LIHKRGLLLVIEPSKLLQDLSVVGVFGQNVLVRVFGAGVLQAVVSKGESGD